MLAVIPSRTDPTRPLGPQAFQNAFYQFPSVERFVLGLLQRDSDSVLRLCFAALAVFGGATLGGGLPTAALIPLSLAVLSLAALLAMASAPTGVRRAAWRFVRRTLRGWF